MARKYFAASNPIGKRFRIRETDRLSNSVEIVGAVTDSKYGSLREEMLPTVFFSLNRTKAPESQMTFELRAGGGAPVTLISAVASAMAEINPRVSIDFTTLAAKVNDSIERERLVATLAGLFSGLALLLATIGLYGVTSYSVGRRRNEIGIRMALGADHLRVVRMILSEVALPVSIGL